MKTIQLVIDLTYDDELYHLDDPDDLAWFYGLIHRANDLFLSSKEVGDVIGTVEVVQWLETEGE